MSVAGQEGTPFDPAVAYPFPELSGDEWALWPELGEGAPAVIHGAACMDCPEQVWVDDDPLPVAVWALEHTRTDPTHRQYLVSTQKHWRVDRRRERPRVSLPRPVPRAEEEPVGERPQLGRRTVACPRVIRNGLARLGRYAGPLTLVLFSSGCGFVLGALLATAPG